MLNVVREVALQLLGLSDAMVQLAILFPPEIFWQQLGGNMTVQAGRVVPRKPEMRINGLPTMQFGLIIIASVFCC